VALLLFLASLFLALALVSYTPNDLLTLKQGFNPEQSIVNLTGRAGVALSELLFWTFGAAAFLIPLILVFYSFRLFLEKPFRMNLIEPVGFIVFIVAVSALLALRFSYINIFGVEISAGGLVGLLAFILKDLFSVAGSYLVLIAVLIASATLAGFFSLGRFFSLLGQLPAFSSRAISRPWPTKERVRIPRPTPKPRAAAEVKVSKPEPPPLARRPVEASQEEFPFARVGQEFKLPALGLLDINPPEEEKLDKEALLKDSQLLEKKLDDFGVEGKVTEVRPGPVITMFEFAPAPGVKISRIVNLADDLALAMRARTVRIVAPVPGKAVVGVEIPNADRHRVYLREILASPQFLDDPSPLRLALGKDISGRPFVTSLTQMPHLLVAGSTGAGKSIFLNSIILSILFQATPDEAKLILIDPKRLELYPYQGIPHLLLPVIVEPKKAALALKWAVEEMERRYQLLIDKGARNIENYNQKMANQDKLPYVVLVIDELADLMMAAGRAVEGLIARLAQMARASGIHLVVATQRPSVDVLTGLIKANFPARISFLVPSKIDSRTILDASGAEHLLGKGDMLFLPPGAGHIVRVHGSFVSEREAKNVIQYLKERGKPTYEHMLPSEPLPEDTMEAAEIDEKYDEAVALVMETGQVSISMIQRRLRIGFNRAARIIERMEEDGLVSKPEPGKPREILRHRVEV
jgi:S-DNA-T family DNA segregation ATPase FtsK/SpoIIIE